MIGSCGPVDERFVVFYVLINEQEFCLHLIRSKMISFDSFYSAIKLY